MKKQLLFLFFTPLISIHHSFAQDSCNKEFLAFDIGSSSSKAFLYSKNVCQKDAKLTLKQSSNAPFNYQGCLNSSSDGKLSSNCITKGIAVLKKMQESYNLCKIKDQCFAIATAWARNTHNIHQWEAATVKINLKSQVISQNHEGKLLLHAIKTQVAQPGEEFLAFDIGGGSFQIMTSNSQIKQYNGLVGTNNFSHQLMQKFPLSCSKCTLSQKDIAAALAWTDEIIGTSIREDEELQAFIRKYQPTIYADSLLFTLSIKQQLKLNQDHIRLEDLYKLIIDLSDKSFNTLQTLYPTIPQEMLQSRQPALILLYTILKNLNLKAYQIVSIDHMASFLDSVINISSAKVNNKQN